MAIDESKYKKSVSNYVIQEKHQSTDKGDIFERDITTIGGKNFFNKNQIPVFKSGNFIITTSASNGVVNGAAIIPNDADEYEDFTFEDLTDTIEEDDTSSLLEVKPDVHDLRNFAYYGSCVELVRASLNNIITNFPGELYATDKELSFINRFESPIKKDVLGNGCFYYTSKGTKTIETTGNTTDLCVVSNPFGLNLHETEDAVSEDLIEESPLKYLGVEKVRENYTLYKKKEKDEEKYTEFCFNVISFDDRDPNCANPYEYLSRVEIKKGKCQDPNTITTTETTDSNIAIVYVFKGENDDFIYLTDNSNWRIKPNDACYKKFKSELSLFERTLLDENSTPKYSPQFEIYKENDWGFETHLEKFTFPVSADGGYNLELNAMSYLSYVNRLNTIAQMYDEYFSDNLYRSMTHEAIKNFDWSYKRNYTELEEHEHVEGGNKIQKLIRVVGRFFDDIKLYIDNIAYANTVTYSGADNTPDYLLSDLVESEGWDYRHVIPYSSEVDDDNVITWHEYSGPVKPYVANDSMSICNLEYTPNDINNLFARLLKLNSRSIWKKKGTIDGIESLLSLFGLRSERLIKKAEKTNVSIEFDCQEENVSKKIDDGQEGQQGGEDNKKNNATLNYDYIIEELVAKTTGTTSVSSVTISEGKQTEEEEKNGEDISVIDDGQEEQQEVENEIKIDVDFNTVNRFKLISYDEDAFLNKAPTRWRGLMVKEGEDGKLYPYFNKDTRYDGEPYYQMYGGWLKKNIAIDDDFNITTGHTHYTETINRIKCVETIKDMLSMPQTMLSDGDYCYVKDINKKIIIIDGYVFDVKDYVDSAEFWQNFTQKELTENSKTKEDYKEKYQKKCYYFDIPVKNGTILIGNTIYFSVLTTKKPKIDGDNISQSPIVIPIERYSNNDMVRLYAYPKHSINNSNEKEFELTDINGNQPNYFSLIVNEENDNAKHYFKLDNVNYSRWLNRDKEITCTKCNGNVGWQQLKSNDEDYAAIKSMKNYYVGNNPHTASIHPSDDGFEYMDYFIHIFKFAIENNLFDWDKLYDYYHCNDSVSKKALLNAIRDFGFKDIASGGCSSYSADTSEKLFTEEDIEKEKEKLFTEEDIEKEKISSDFIINTKRVKITFNYHNNQELIYLDKIVVPYLSQMIPSSLIVEIKYNELKESE